MTAVIQSDDDDELAEDAALIGAEKRGLGRSPSFLAARASRAAAYRQEAEACRQRAIHLDQLASHYED